MISMWQTHMPESMKWTNGGVVGNDWTKQDWRVEKKGKRTDEWMNGWMESELEGLSLKELWTVAGYTVAWDQSISWVDRLSMESLGDEYVSVEFNYQMYKYEGRD